MKTAFKKFIPKRVRNLSHLFYAWYGAIKYGHPSEKLIVIGVTGTSGKSTTVYLLRQILERAGYVVGYLSTIDLYIAGRQIENKARMTMQGKMQTQAYLKQMVDETCDVAIVEMTSEGFLQHRHRFINFDVAVFTNLYPEHIEAHGGFENYKKAKLGLFKYVSRCPKKYHLKNYKKITVCDRIDNVKKECTIIPKTCVVNFNSVHAKDFLKFNFDEKAVYGREDGEVYLPHKDYSKYQHEAVAKGVKISADGLAFNIDKHHFYAPMQGEHTVMNILAAIGAARSLSVEWEDIISSVVNFQNVPGRIEFIKEAEELGFQVLVDFAFEPAGIQTLYNVIDNLKPKRIIQVCGSAGGGRDKARRAPIGRLVGEKADIFIVTNEDSFDEEPIDIIKVISGGAQEVGKKLGTDLFEVEDRGEAIKKAIGMAKKGDLVLITGKGNEQKMFVKNNQTIDWDDRKVAREAIKYRKLAG